MVNEMSVECGNPKHPDGAWHQAEPLAGSWQWDLSIRQWIRSLWWGCSCPREKK